MIAIHGRRDADDAEVVWLGGRDTILRQAVAGALLQHGFAARVETDALAGAHRDNICNRGATGAGVQLELPRTLRDRLRNDEILLRDFASAVRSALPTA